MSLSTSVQKRQTFRLPNPDATVDNDDKFATLGLVGTETTAPTGIADALKSLILRHPTPDATVDNLDKYASLGLVYPIATGGPLIERFTLGWFIDPTWSEAERQTTGQFEVVINSFSTNIEGENSNAKRLKGGISRKAFKRGFVIEHRGELIPLASLSEVDAFLERAPDAVVHDVGITHQVEEKEVYESPSLRSEQLKAIYGDRPRFGQREIEKEPEGLPERSRYIPREVTEETTLALPTRQRFVARQVEEVDNSLPERLRYVQREEQQEDPLEQILRRRRR